MCLAERISGSTLPSLQVIYLKRCKSRAAKIIKDSNHPGNHLFRLLPSGKRFRSMMAKTERLRRSFFPQAIRLLNTKTQTLFNKHKNKIKISRLHIPLIPPVVCTSLSSLSSLLFIVLFIKSHILFLHILLVLHILLFCTFLYSTAHFTFYFFFYLYICSCVVLLLYNFFILCTVH